MTKNQPQKKFKTIYSLDEIPTHFESEDAERDFWAEHDLSEELWNSLPNATDRLDKIAPLPEGTQRRKRMAS